MAKKKNKVLIVISGGYVETVFSGTDDLDVDVIDRDILEKDEGFSSADTAMEVALKSKDMKKVYSS